MDTGSILATQRGRASPRRGFSLVEGIISLALLAILVTTSLSFLADWRKFGDYAEDRAFAVQTAISLIEEVRDYSQQSEMGDAAELDALDDGVDYYNNVLTIQAGAFADDPASGNRTSSRSASGWKYSRRLVVRPFAGLDNTRDVRIVSAMVYRDEPDGSHTLLGDIGTVLKTPGDAYPTTQVYDVYFLSIENIPGWWVYMAHIKPLMLSTVADLQARNPGLELRAHWITKSTFGRDWRYMPYINEHKDSEQDIDWVYFYPGTMPAGSAAEKYYVADQMGGRMWRDDPDLGEIEINGFTDVAGDQYNPWPYALADEYNHGMRYIDEVIHFNRRCSVETDDPSTPTWRILLERMSRFPEAYENAILINLHGELLPMPAIRNYSDPAKDPADFPGVRVVAHPRYLRTPTDTDLQLRVYAYRDPFKDLAVADADAVAPPITVTIKNVDLAARINEAAFPTLTITRVFGGVDGSAGAGKDGLADPYGSDPAPAAESSEGEMYYAAQHVDGDTVITLYNSPLICPYDNDPGSPSYQKGLRDAWRLYSIEYIPSSTEASSDFSRDLTAAINKPKNTARWIITIPEDRREDVEDELTYPHDGVSEVRNRLTIETRIGTDLTTGIMWPTLDRNQPENLSRTYAWWTDNLMDVPFTERSQFLGDPRHCPYADLKDAAPVLSFPNHYNWWFDNFKAGTYNAINNWEGYSASRLQNDEAHDADGWGDHHIRIDVPRYFELLRTGLTSTNSLYTTLTGYSYYYMAIGNEIGYDSANGFPKSIPVSKKPFYGISGARTEQVITSGGSPTDASTIGNGTKLIKRGKDLEPVSWWGKHWMGELYPDEDWTIWETSGNLPTGNTDSTYVRTKREAIMDDLPRGTVFTVERRCTAPEGCNSFFLVGTRSNTFYHAFRDGDEGALTSSGTEIAQNYSFSLPGSAPISRPFRFDWSGSSSWKDNDDFDFTGDYPHNSMEEVRRFYDHPWSSPNGMGSTLAALSNPTGTNTSFQVVNGIDRTVEAGSAFIAKWSLLTLVHGFLTAGEEATQDVAAVRIRQLPRIKIERPTIITEMEDPNAINIQWSSEFTRWDGNKYTQYYPDGFHDLNWLDDLRYVLLYSKDNGKTWYYMEDDEPAEAGENHDIYHYMEDLEAYEDETYEWAVPAANFPEGSYLIRVEAHRNGIPLHYAYHTEKVFIER